MQWRLAAPVEFSNRRPALAHSFLSSEARKTSFTEPISADARTVPWCWMGGCHGYDKRPYNGLRDQSERRVGKSTISALLARRGFTHRELDVLAIDLDPQANLSQGLMRNDYQNFQTQKRPSIVEVFNGYISPTANSPAATPLSSAISETIAKLPTRSLELIPSRFDFSDNLLGAVRPDPKALARYLASTFQHKDLIIIDCSPTESILTTAAYHASGKVLIPVKPEYFATIGFPLLQQSLSSFRIGIADKQSPSPVWL